MKMERLPESHIQGAGQIGSSVYHQWHCWENNDVSWNIEQIRTQHQEDCLDDSTETDRTPVSLKICPLFVVLFQLLTNKSLHFSDSRRAQKANHVLNFAVLCGNFSSWTPWMRSTICNSSAQAQIVYFFRVWVNYFVNRLSLRSMTVMWNDDCASLPAVTDLLLILR